MVILFRPRPKVYFGFFSLMCVWVRHPWYRPFKVVCSFTAEMRWSTLFFQETPKMNYLREYYERALQEFGTSDDGKWSWMWNVASSKNKSNEYLIPNTLYFYYLVDLWLQYIQEELSPLGQPENCGKIHWRAMKFLEGESVERFISKYTLFQTGHLWGKAGADRPVLQKCVKRPHNTMEAREEFTAWRAVGSQLGKSRTRRPWWHDSRKTSFI